MKRSVPPGCIGIGLLIFFLLLIPFFLTHLFVTALDRLYLSPGASILILFALLIGSTINIPIKRTRRTRRMHQVVSRMFGLNRLVRPLTPEPSDSVIAVNVGGCVVPCGIAIYEIGILWGTGADAVVAALFGVISTTIVCYAVARPVRGVGITMPTLIPPLTAALSALLFTHLFSTGTMAPPVAFVSGVLGTLIGADLLHLKDVERISTGFASIGGAGTFDGIVLSGLIATLLA